MLPNQNQRRVRVIVAYDGTEYHGWQVQPGLATIQGILEEILSRIEGRHVTVHGSGRTDAGVHAQAQTAAFTMSNPIPPYNLQRAMNRLLPPSIRILAAEEADLDFHPRFDAVAKTYEYRVFCGPVCPPLIWRYVHHHPYPLTLEPMREAASVFEGEHDFTAFSSADSRDVTGASKVRRIFASSLQQQNEFLVYSVKGSGFLKHMVRKMVGALLETGKGNISVDQLRLLLHAANRRHGGHNAPAKGLHLMSVEYQPPRSPLIP
jgi:tRNA pseudouridine38-40 synthase